MTTTNHIFAWTYFAVYICVYSPFLFHHLRRYKQQKSHIVYTLRYSKITIIQCEIFIFKLIFNTAQGMTYMYDMYGHDSLTNRILTAINAYIAAFFLYCFVWKFWLLRFNIKLHSDVIGSEWKSVIDHEHYAHSNSFYVKYRRKLGKPKPTMRVCMAMAFFFTSFYVATQFYHGNVMVHTLFTEFDYIIPFVILLPILCLTPKFEVSLKLKCIM